ncbi:MAG: DUF1015 family protein [Anaerovoracaceae bacterium]
MARLTPFSIIHPKPEYAASVCAPPYDVVDRQEAHRLAEGNPYSFLRISRSEIELPKETDPYAPVVYERARDNLKRWLDQGILVREPGDCYMIYRQTSGKRIQTGIVGCASISDYENDRIRKHEVTREEKEQDRTQHFTICNAHTEPVFLTYRSSHGIDVTIKKWIAEHDCLFDFYASDGVRHQVWLVNEAGAVEVLSMIFEEVPYLYIADGHHRAASAVTVARNRRSEGKGSPNLGEEGFLAVCFPTFDLEIMDYNRLIRDLNKLTVTELLYTIEQAGFRIKEISEPVRKPAGKGSYAMYLQRKWYSLQASEDFHTGDPIADLDVSILQDRILAPVLGIRDPRTDPRIDFAGGIHGLQELKRRVDSGDAAVAFALHPVSMDELLCAADAGQMMPPKSTWFEPKLASGLFIHALDE